MSLPCWFAIDSPVLREQNAQNPNLVIVQVRCITYAYWWAHGVATGIGLALLRKLTFCRPYGKGHPEEEDFNVLRVRASRGKYWYDCDETDGSGADTAMGCSDTLLFPLYLLGGILLMYLAPVLLVLCLLGFGIHTIYTRAKAFVKNAKRSHLALIMAAILVVEALVCVFLYLQIRSLPSVRNLGVIPCHSTSNDSMRADRPATANPRPPAGAGAPSYAPHLASTPIPSHAPTPGRTARIFPVIVDDFEQQPIQGQPAFFYNRLDGDRGAIGDCP